MQRPQRSQLPDHEIKHQSNTTEQVTAIPPTERVRTALYALSSAGTTRLLVRRRPHLLPEGVITDFDLAVAAAR